VILREQDGFTLLELMIVMAIMSIVMISLYTLGTNMQLAAATTDARITSQDDVRTGMQFIGRELRQATTASLGANKLPSETFSYQRVADLDSNGFPVNASNLIELTPTRVITRDVDDLNDDGRTLDQVVLVQEKIIRVIANGVVLDEDKDANGILDEGEDANRNNVLDRGLWFESVGNGVLVTLQSQRGSGPSGHAQISTIMNLIAPRN